ncbi:uncharacterized protein LOC117953484 [Etheostoma cragini]|uniref:uncharacterized protein LOC117953484 n=1 Tax=Etheostoma cragini TaxID=417921 RepID=UPI00155ED5DB|nr:uncharacterized protein LOC117953484 [Etheostoma cragini]
MEKSMMPSKALRVSVEEDALASQVPEIIGGITVKTLQTLEEPEERDVLSLEEGDDSVFYSDEDQAQQDIKVNMSCGFGANKCKNFVNSVAADEDDPGEESIMDEDIAEPKEEVTQHIILTEQEECHKLQTPKTDLKDVSDPSDPGAESDLTQEKSVSTFGESLNCTTADMQTQQIISAEKANLPVEKEVTPKNEPFNVTNEKSYTRLNREADIPEQMSSAERQISGDRKLQVEPEQDHNSHVPMGVVQNASPGYSTLPLPKKSCGSVDHQKSFNHLSSSKYSTVSYRKIRRGNTRQKIEEFEYMVMNL